MAIRLSVLAVHSPPAIPGAQQLAESIVGELIGRPGIDVTLVGSLERIAENSTDALTLESITGDVAVLDWREPTDLIERLAALGFRGTRARHVGDRLGDEATAGRKIYAFDLTQVSDAKQLCRDLQSLLASRQVKTISIGGLDPNQPRSNQPGSNQPRSNQPGSIQPGSKPDRPPHSPSSANPIASPPPAHLPGDERLAEPPEAIPPAATPGDGIDLDDLVDQLDQLDP